MNGNGRNSFYLGVLPWEEYFHHWSHWFYGESPRRKAAEIMSGNKECLHSHKTKERQRCQPETGGIACIKGKHQFCQDYILLYELIYMILDKKCLLSVGNIGNTHDPLIRFHESYYLKHLATIKRFLKILAV